MNALLYSTRGPLRGQDGREVWTVVRLLEAPDGIQPSAVAVAECLSLRMAEEHAKALNGAHTVHSPGVGLGQITA